MAQIIPVNGGGGAGGGGGDGDMKKSVYDPNNVNANAFDYNNFTNTPDLSDYVDGPASSTDGNVVLFDGATGKLIKDSGVGLSSKLDASALSNNNYGGAWENDSTHTPTKGALYTKIHTMDVEIGNKAADNTVVKLSGNQTINGTKTFGTSPVVPSKTTDATNTGTTIATEAQVYKKQDTLVSGTNIKTVNNNSLLGSGNLTLNDVKVSATAPSSPTEGMVWYDTTNDQLKVYDGTNWNVTGKEYNDGEGIEIKNGPDYSAMQGPAPSGFHIPLTTEWQAVYDIWTALGGGSSAGTNFGIALKLPFAGHRSNSSAGVDFQGTYGRYWSSSRYNTSNAYILYFYSASLSPQSNNRRAYGFSVRCFKDTPTIPTSSWTKLYGTSIEAGGIFWSSTDGLISLSSDGNTWITIADKNLGATTVWNSGDTLSEANCGYYYQRGNNYGFPRTGTIANQSTTQVDASTYGPGNYYSSDTFIKYNGRWDTTDNWNLWGGETGIVTLNNAITNTGVLSVNGKTGAVVLDADDIDDTNTTNKWTNDTEKNTWNGKQDALTLPATPTQGNLVTWGADNETLVDGGAIPTGVPSGGNNGDVLTNVSGTATWQAPSGGDVMVSSQSGNILTSGMKIWAGTEADYGNLGSYDQNTIYLTI